MIEKLRVGPSLQASRLELRLELCSVRVGPSEIMNTVRLGDLQTAVTNGLSIARSTMGNCAMVFASPMMRQYLRPSIPEMSFSIFYL